MNNFERVYLQASESERAMGFHWYLDNHNYLKEMAGALRYDFKAIAGIAAVLSPGMTWMSNLNLAYNIVKNRGKMDKVKTSAYKLNIEKALKIYKTKKVFPSLKGPKVTEFYFNLLNPFDEKHVTIDSFMIACRFEAQNIDNLKKYTAEKHIEILKSEIFDLAKKYNILPCQFQAIVWITYHRIIRSFSSYTGQLQLKLF